MRCDGDIAALVAVDPGQPCVRHPCVQVGERRGVDVLPDRTGARLWLGGLRLRLLHRFAGFHQHRLGIGEEAVHRGGVDNGEVCESHVQRRVALPRVGSSGVGVRPKRHELLAGAEHLDLAFRIADAVFGRYALPPGGASAEEVQSLRSLADATQRALAAGECPHHG